MTARIAGRTTKMNFLITDEFGHAWDTFFIPWEELYRLKETFICTVQYGQIILY